MTINPRLIAASIAVSSILAIATPTFAHAATFAFVNTSQEVSMVTADNWMAAMTNALNIDEHSGVILLTAQNAGIVGKKI
jgi:hypothetical protein